MTPHFELYLLALLTVLAGLLLLAYVMIPPLLHWVQRLIWWHRVRPYSARYIRYRKNAKVWP